MLFISYSHQDEDFVNRLVAQLMERRVRIWWDRVGIKVGESLLEKIQGAISTADALAIVLSKASVASAWCREELNAGLVRQFAEKRIVVLPLLIEDCDIPLFLREKKYADFRKDCDAGFGALLEAVGALVEPTLGRHQSDEYQSDYGMDWAIRDGRFVMTIDAVSFSKSEPISVMAKVEITANETATRRYMQYAEAGLKDLGVNVVVGSCEAIFDSPEAHITLADNHPVTLQSGMADPKTGIGYEVSFWARRIGQATGMAVLYHFGAIFGPMFKQLIASRRPLSAEEKAKLAAILRHPPG